MIPKHLSGTLAFGFVQQELIAQFELGKYKNFIYLILDWDLKKAAIVDPQEDLNEILNKLNQFGFSLEAILITHSHHDHIAGVAPLLQKVSNLALYIHPLELHRLEGIVPQKIKAHLLKDGDRIQVGSLSVKTMHTPGHSAGECCFFISGERSYLLSGDTVFIQDCGRTDLPTGNVRQMYESLQLIKKLPPDTLVLPGHHYGSACSSVLESELRQSPPFLCQSVEELAELP